MTFHGTSLKEEFDLWRSPISPVPGESRMLEQPSQTKNIEEFDDRFEVDVGLFVVHADDLRLAVGDGGLERFRSDANIH